jgi:spoIIIJ-associated protein
LEERVEIAKELMLGLLQRMGMETEVEGLFRDGELHLEVKSDAEGILIGKHGRTLESFQILINRMVNKRLREPVRVILDIAHYKKRRADSLAKMAARLGENAKRTGKGVTIGPLNAHDRRIIHVTLKEDPSLRTESLGDGEMKRIRIIPAEKEGGKIGPLE